MSDPVQIDPHSFRNALGAFTTGVTIVTTRDTAGNDIGLTANSFNSVSLDPPLVLWSLAKSSLSLKAFVESRYFAVHILAAEQRGLSELFAKRGADKFAGMTPERGHGGVPLLGGCAARFECETEFRYDGGDHEIFVGRVIDFEHFQRSPLVFAGGQYAVALRADKPSVIEDHAYNSYDSLNYLITNAHYLLSQKYRALMSAHRINQAQIYTLLLLGMSAPQTQGQINAALTFTGCALSPSAAVELVERDYIVEAGGGAYELTEAGRILLIEISAVRKAGEEEAQSGLEFGETQILRLLLKRLVRGLFKAHAGGT